MKPKQALHVAGISLGVSLVGLLIMGIDFSGPPNRSISSVRGLASAGHDHAGEDLVTVNVRATCPPGEPPMGKRSARHKERRTNVMASVSATFEIPQKDVPEVGNFIVVTVGRHKVTCEVTEVTEPVLPFEPPEDGNDLDGNGLVESCGCVFPRECPSGTATANIDDCSSFECGTESSCFKDCVQEANDILVTVIRGTCVRVPTRP
jgi:hypothetical protein